MFREEITVPDVFFISIRRGLALGDGGLARNCMKFEDVIDFDEAMSGFSLGRPHVLCALLTHDGMSVDSGHYTACTRRGAEWWNLNCVKVTQMTPAQLHSAWLGRHVCCFVYVRATVVNQLWRD
jgi:hypothetical protein